MSDICCRLDAFSGPQERDRHQALLRRVREVTTSLHEVEGGLRLTLVAQGAAFVDVASWIVLERRCCPFLAFTLAWDGDAPLLTITGPPGAAGLVRDALAAA